MSKPTKKLTRSTEDKWIGGVCGGLAQYTGIDANLIRLAVAVAAVLGFGTLVLAYLVAWVIMPRPADPWSDVSDAPPRPPAP